MINSPETALHRGWARISKRTKVTFIAAMVLGLLAHMTMFTNKLPNHDDAWYMFGAVDGVQSGRWLLPWLLQVDGPFSMPWLLGLLGLIFLALTACVVTKLYRIDGVIGCTLAAGLLVTFPSVAATYSYMFTSDAYFFGVLLAALAAYVATRDHVMALPGGALLLMLSLGIYQSYLPMAVALMLGALIFEVLDAEKSFPRLVWKGVRLLFTIGLGVLAYMGVARLATRDVGLTPYMGIDNMGTVDPKGLPSLIVKCYTEYGPMFFKNSLGYNFDIVNVLLVIGAGCAIVLAACTILWKRPGVLRGIMAAVLMVLLPLAANMIHIMVNGGLVHTLMIYGMVLVPIFVIGLACTASKCVAQKEQVTMRSVNAILSWALVAVLTATTFSYVVTDNAAYFKMNMNYEQLKAYSQRLLTTVESIEGYQEGTPLVVVEYKDPNRPATVLSPELSNPWMVGMVDPLTFTGTNGYDEFLKRYLAYPGNVYSRTSDEAKVLSENPTVLNMPAYPNPGSIKLIDGQMVVKFVRGASEQ